MKGWLIAGAVVAALVVILLALNPKIRCEVTFGDWRSEEYELQGPAFPGDTSVDVERTPAYCDYD